MSLMGIDVGTTGCKATVFNAEGVLLASAYREYDIQHPQPGYAELDAHAVWTCVQEVIAETAQQTGPDPVTALSVSSLGEAMVAVDENRVPLGPSILNFDVRGADYLAPLAAQIDPAWLYAINGNTLGNHYGLTKLLWIRDHQPEIYQQARAFLLWGGFIAHQLGAEPTADYSLANRTLLFDLERQDWSDALLSLTGLDRAKLGKPVPPGAVIGTVDPAIAAKLGLSSATAIVAGTHDQCANATGCGAIHSGVAMFGMGTFLCAVPVFSKRQPPERMIPHGLNTEHHAAPGQYVSFIYNQGGSLLKWYRDTFAAAERDAARAQGRDVYPDLIAEMPDEPGGILVLPHFTTTGPPSFISDSSGVILGLRLETSRGAVLRGILESVIYYMREALAPLDSLGLGATAFRAVGGGSRSDAWLQICADILERPMIRTQLSEAGALGSALLAGASTGVFASIDQGVEAMVRTDRVFEPNSRRKGVYAEKFAQYAALWPLMKDYLTARA